MTETRPFIRMRGRTIMALVLTPEPPLPNWLASLDAQIERAPNFFDGRPVIVDVGTLPSDTPDVASFMHAIVGRGIHIIGMEGAHPTWRGLEAWGRALPGAGKPGKPIEIPEPPQTAPAPRNAAPAGRPPQAAFSGPALRVLSIRSGNRSPRTRRRSGSSGRGGPPPSNPSDYRVVGVGGASTRRRSWSGFSRSPGCAR